MSVPQNKAVFLDRDGVINVPVPPHQYVIHPDDFSFLPGITTLVQAITEKGFLPIVISNQGGIGRGVFKKEMLDVISEKMRADFAIAGAPLTDVYYCIHSSTDNCDCRKPKPGMLLAAAKKWDIDLAQSYMVGDRAPDIGAGHAAGCATIFVSHGELNQDQLALCKPEYVVQSLEEIIPLIK